VDLTTSPDPQVVDTGLIGLALIARFYGVAVEPAQLKHQFGAPGQPFGISEMLRAARALGLKARAIESTWARLATTPVPALAALSDGSYLVIGAVGEDKILVQIPGDSRPTTLSTDEFLARWSGSLLLVTKRSLLPGMSGKFDLSWFIPSLLKYRKLLGEVLLASFFIQLLALVTPLFFQVVIDKVLVHQGLTTLDVLAIGLLVVSLFEVVLGGLRTYLFSHTASRVDVELGAKLYQHLQGLPVAFFLARPVGTIVARVRELENIRNFITGSTLTLVIDLVFTVIFFAVMFYYSPTLFWVVEAAIPFYVGLSIVVTPILRRRLNE
jgi:subfamily B ATP-binding cassette protein HlyB/CyaB